MSARTFTEIRPQYAVEASSGVAVPANKRFPAGTLHMVNKPSMEKIETSGEYFASGTYRTGGNSEGTFDGTPDFAVLPDLLTLVYGEPTVTDALAADAETVIGKQYVWSLKASRPTWTIEQGDSRGAERYTNVLASGYNVEFGSNSKTSSIAVDMKGNLGEDIAGLTAALPVAQAKPIGALNVSVFVDDGADQLGATPFDKFLSAKIDFGDIADFIRYFGSTDTVNTKPSASVTLMGEVNEKTIEIERSAANRAIYYVRIQAVGDTLPAGVDGETETVSFDFALRVADGVGERGEQESVYASTLPFVVVKDATDFAHQVSMVLPA